MKTWDLAFILKIGPRLNNSIVKWDEYFLELGYHSHSLMGKWYHFIVSYLGLGSQFKFFGSIIIVVDQLGSANFELSLFMYFKANPLLGWVYYTRLQDKANKSKTIFLSKETNLTSSNRIGHEKIEIDTRKFCIESSSSVPSMAKQAQGP